MVEKNKFWLSEFFDYFGITQAEVAREAKIPATVMRQYVCGAKNPSDKRLREIEKAVRRIGRRLSKVSIRDLNKF